MMLLIVILVILFLAIFLITKQKGITVEQTFVPKDCQNGNIDLILEPVSNDKKIIVMKDLRLILNLDLKTCKYIIENAPIVILKNISDEQVEYFKDKFVYAGINVTFRDNLS